MGWQPFDLDHLALEIVLKARENDPNPKKTILNQAHKMRITCAYGLERFWGEHLRLASQDQLKADFVIDVWKALVGIMAMAGLTLPGDVQTREGPEPDIAKVAERLWALELQDQQNAIAVLTALCDSVVWWTQRLKPPGNTQGEAGSDE